MDIKIMNYKKRKFNKSIYLFLALGAFAILFRVIYGQGLTFADDFKYIQAALNANEMGWINYLVSISTPFQSRLFIVFPLAIFIKIFGAS